MFRIDLLCSSGFIALLLYFSFCNENSYSYVVVAECELFVKQFQLLCIRWFILSQQLLMMLMEDFFGLVSCPITIR